jgi:hypothetical protein
MQPITPARFYELLGKSDDKDYRRKSMIRLWKKGETNHEYYVYIYVGHDDLFYAQPADLDRGDGIGYKLSMLYESKPRTAYDDLQDCVSPIGSEPKLHICKFERLYKSELESIPSKMEDK